MIFNFSIYFSEAFGKHFMICLHVKVEKDTFKWNRFHVNKNNLRPKDYLPNASDNSDTGQRD